MINSLFHKREWALILLVVGAWLTFAGSSHASDSYSYAGENTEAATGVSYNRARYYEPETGTFLTKDPLGVSGGANGYRYANNDPVNVCDPTGTTFYQGFKNAIIPTLIGAVVVTGLVIAAPFVLPASAAAAVVSGIAYVGITVATAQVAVFDAKAISGQLTPDQIDTQFGEIATQVAGGALVGGVGSTFVPKISPLDGGAFVITDFSGFPDVAPQPEGPLVLVDDPEYSAARTAANAENKALAQEYDIVGTGQDIHEIVPVKFGGDPVDISNKTPLLASDHSDVTNWFNSLQSDIEGGDFSGIQLIDPVEGSATLPGFVASGIGGASVGDLTFDLSQSDDFSSNFDDVGGVLINKAATLVGQNLSDIKGVTYDPKTNQLVILGSQTLPSSTVPGIDMDYFYTAVQAVYGSATPPYVTLNTPVNEVASFLNFTTSTRGATINPGETGGFTLTYTPNWPQVDNSVTVRLQMHDSNNNHYDISYNLNALYATSYTLPNSGLHPMLLTYNNTTTNNGSPSLGNFVLTTAPFSATSLSQTPAEPVFNPLQQHEYEDVSYPVRFTNNTGLAITVDGVLMIPDQQHRVYGGRVDGTKLGWVMYEADRMLKCLTVGKDDLNGAISYSSTSGNVSVPGYKNLLELAGTTPTVYARMWFEPNQMTLQSYVNPTTGQATVGFTTSTVELLTQSQIAGQPSDPASLAFATFFNANYDKFAAQSFTVLDPTDPLGKRTISTPIFAQLRQAMQAVSLARFFHDNNIPLDKWWMSSYQPPTANTAKSVPTAYNTANNGATQTLIYGGILIQKPNTYVPNANAQALGANVLGSNRPGPSPTDPQDLPAQVWSATDPNQGALTAVAASLGAAPQVGNVNLTETDLSFATPGQLPLTFNRYYQSSWLGQGNLGQGWGDVRYMLQFSSPSLWDENHYLSAGPAGTIATAADGDTYIRSGTIRLVDLVHGSYLDFQSSAQLVTTVDSLGNPISTLNGLGSSNLPTFSTATHGNGTILVQNNDGTFGYTATLPDGSTLSFDPSGNLLKTTDRHGKSLTYGYDTQGRLSTITDSVTPTPQAISVAYDPTSGMLSTATGPTDSTSYQYDSSGRLDKVIHTAVDPGTGQPVSVVIAQYAYNTQNQLVSVTRMDGTTPITTSADVKGRSSTRMDANGNSTAFTYTQSSNAMHTTTALDPNSGLPASQKITDPMGRTMSVTDSLGHTTSFTYTGSSLSPSSVTLPTAGRPAIQILRNAFGQPTSISDPAVVGGQPAQMQYDPTTSKLIQVSDSGGNVTKFMYTSAHHDLQTLRHLHNGANVDLNFGYDGQDNLTSVTDPLNKTWNIGRDNLGRITSVSDPTGVTDSCTYDSNGNIDTVTDPRLNGVKLHYSYDSLHRITSITSPTGSSSYQYDPVTQYVKQETQKDAQGNVLQTLSYAYNSAGLLTGKTVTLTQPGVTGSTNLTTQVGYDSYGHVTSVTAPGALPATYTVNAEGQQVATSETNSGPAVGPSIIASNASNGAWTNQASQTMGWGAPESSLPITGYNYAEDASTSLTVNTTGGSVAWNNIPDGKHTFHVRAQDSGGNWSPESVFNLWIDTTPPSVSITGVTPNPLPQGSVTVTVNANVTDAGSGLVGVPDLRWCVSSDTSRPWSSYSAMTGGGLNQWSSSFVEPGTGQTLYYQIQAQDAAGNVQIFSGSLPISGPSGNDGPLMPPLALALLALLFFGVGNWLLNRRPESGKELVLK